MSRKSRNHRFLGRIGFAAAIVLQMTGPVVAQQPPDLRTLSQTMSRLERTYRNAAETSVRLSRAADSLAAVVTVMKRQKDAGMFDSRRLANSMSAAKRTADMLERQQRQEREALGALIQFSDRTLKILNKWLDAIPAAQKSGAGEPAVQSASVRQSIAEAKNLRGRCQQYLNPPAPHVALEQIRLETDDSAEAVAQKRDFVLDQADRLQRAAHSAEVRILKIREEVLMRNRLADFVEDLSVLDPADESAVESDGAVARDASNTEQIGADDFTTDPTGRLRAGENSIVGTSTDLERLWTGQIDRLSPELLDSMLATLAEGKRLWSRQADSLRARAGTFEKVLQQMQNRVR